MTDEATKPASCLTACDLKCGNVLNYDTAEGEHLLLVTIAQ
jgi:hypothetical protein